MKVKEKEMAKISLLTNPAIKETWNLTEEEVDLECGFIRLRLAKEDLVDGQVENHGENMENQSEQREGRKNKEPGVPKMGYVLSKR